MMDARTPNSLAVALALLLGFGMLALWVREQWPVSVVQVGIYLLAALWLTGVALGRLPMRFHPMMVPLAGAAVWGACNWPRVRRSTAGLPRWRFWTGSRGWRCSSWRTSCSPSRGLASRFLRWLLWFGFALSLVAILQRYTSPDRVFWLFDVAPGGVTMGPFVYHNQYAAFIETVLPLALWAAFRKGRLDRADHGRSHDRLGDCGDVTGGNG